VAELAAHARHDRLLVAQSLDRGARRSVMLELCVRCAALYADLVAMTLALPLSAVPSRPRDFRLSASDARRLGRRRWWGWSAMVGSKWDALSRPLALGFTTVGLAGQLLTAGPLMLAPIGGAIGSGSAASAPLVRDATSAEPSEVPFVALGVEPTAAPPERLLIDSAEDPAPMLAVSAGLLGVGIGVFAARHVADRRRRVR
jgi:hypothetical protein